MPFFFTCTPDNLLSEAVTCFLSPFFNPQDLKVAFMDGQDHIQISRADQLYARDFFEGSRLAFFYEQDPDEKAKDFISADRTYLQSRWKTRLHQPFYLPLLDNHQKIPVPPHAGHIRQFANVACPDDKSILVYLKGNKLFSSNSLLSSTLSFDGGLPDSSEEWDQITWISSCGTGDEGLYVFQEEQLFYLNRNNKWQKERIILPSETSLGHVLAYQQDHVNRRQFFLLSDDNIHIYDPDNSSYEAIHLISSQDPLLPGKELRPVKDGVLFIDKEKRGLYFARLLIQKQQLRAEKILGPLPHSSLSFCTDEQGIVFAVDNASRRLYCLLPPWHWNCFVCGEKGVDYLDRRCKNCGTPLPAQYEFYRLWFDINLDQLGGGELGPLHIDHEYRLFLVSEGCKLFMISLRKKDFWG